MKMSLWKGFVLVFPSMADNAHDGHKLPEALKQARRLGDTAIQPLTVDLGTFKSAPRGD